MGYILGVVTCSFEKERWFIFRVMLQSIGKMSVLQFFKPYYFPKIEVDSVCLSLGKRSERVSAEKGTGSIEVAIHGRVIVKRKSKRVCLATYSTQLQLPSRHPSSIVYTMHI